MLKRIDLNNAKWISPNGQYPSPMFRKSFFADDIKSAKITIACLGFFEGYINGKLITEDKFVPLNTDFHKREGLDYCGHIFEEELAHRLYCPVYDVTELLQKGKNLLAIMIGSGWYERVKEPEYSGFGTVKLAYSLEIMHSDGSVERVVSDEMDKVKESFVKKSDVVKGETHNYSNYDDNWINADFDDSDWDKAFIEEAPETNLYEQDCPADRVIRSVKVKKLWEKDGVCLYDTGEIMSGYPIFKINSDDVKVRYGELLNEDGNLLDNGFYGNIYWQHTDFLNAKGRVAHSKFTWYCFRYIEVTGDAEVLDCQVIHTNAEVNSAFSCDNDTLNWLYDAFLRTQLANMHGGIPSDCPHAERRGYTGDGQLVARAAMRCLDGEKFYKKWIYDISDCQDRKSGHVQYTAPFSIAGGGPGGWGGAMVFVPYYYYKHYGDKEILEQLYPQMLKYFDYLETHSENELVTSDRPGVWCLGEWCTPEQLILDDKNGVKVPPPFVNTYFYIKTMQIAVEIEKILGKNEKTPMLQERIERKKAVMTKEYFNPETGDFCENKQGGNAFAADIGLGDERTVSNMISHYDKLGHYDTGIFGTDIVTRLLFEKGRGDVAYKLLSSEDTVSFYNQKKTGATTILENWNGVRSQCHPMFGAVTAYLSEYILGIHQTDTSAGFEEVVIEPMCMNEIKSAKGYITTVKGKISVEYDEKQITVSAPDSIRTRIVADGREIRKI